MYSPSSTDTFAKGSHCGVPQNKVERESIRSLVDQYHAQQNLVPPISLNVLKSHARSILNEGNLSETYFDFVTVLIGNAVWEKTVASVPYDRRLLLIPQCLRSRKRCPAAMDEYGLLCENCGCCPTGDFVQRAEAMGYVVLVAEGTTFVTQLLESGQVEAVIGVGCLESLENSFPYTIASAIPSLAIPLYKEGCDHTLVDVDWVQKYILKLEDSSNDASSHRANISETRNLVSQWFTESELKAKLDDASKETTNIAVQSLLSGGKRWRPTIAVSTYRALKNATELPSLLQNIALSVECFHKASLIHDDIEDNDTERYGKPTLHEDVGTAVAINVGDYLIGEGYRFLTLGSIDDALKVQLLTTAVQGHRSLSLGQGEELVHRQSRKMLMPEEIIEIFRLKTAPAFEVALKLGAICAGADDKTIRILSDFSRALGIAYQIRDDIEDVQQDALDHEEAGLKPSLISAMAWEIQSSSPIEQVGGLRKELFQVKLPDIIKQHQLIEKAWSWFDSYHDQALDVLSGLGNQNLKRLLFQLTFKILGDAAFRRKRKNALMHRAERMVAQAK